MYNSAFNDADVISMDLDGNDIYLVEELLANGASPKLFIVEYNGKFPPHVRFKIKYNAKHLWAGDDYFGASLLSFCELFEKYNYRLVCCNTSGANAFFVKRDFDAFFYDVPSDINEIYVEPFYFFPRKKMHPTSVKTIQLLIQ